MSADIGEKENVREYANKAIDKQKNNNKYEEKANKISHSKGSLSGNNLRSFYWHDLPKYFDVFPRRTTLLNSKLGLVINRHAILV